MGLNILCFGDSLTEGYTLCGTQFTPYAKSMETYLREYLSDDVVKEGLTVRVEGRSGELVLRGMRRRMEKIFRDRQQALDEEQDAKDDSSSPSTNSPASSSETPNILKKFDILIFLGGTNDVGTGGQASYIYPEIVKVTDIARRNDGCKVLLCTVPECGVRSESLDRRRAELNELIKKDEREDVYIFDLFARIKYHDMEREERERIWDDGLHFTEEGYERMGMLIGRRLLGILEGGEGREDLVEHY